MIHISYWFLLTGLGLYVIYFLSGLLTILIINCFDLIVNKLKLKIKPQAQKLLDFFEKNNGKFIKLFLYFTIICLIGIPLNNLVFHIRQTNKIESYNLLQNKEYIESLNIQYFYKITSGPIYRTNDFVIYYVWSNKSIEEIQKDKFIKVSKTLYVEPIVILQISKEEFLSKTTERVLKNE